MIIILHEIYFFIAEWVSTEILQHNIKVLWQIFEVRSQSDAQLFNIIDEIQI